MAKKWQLSLVSKVFLVALGTTSALTLSCTLISADDNCQQQVCVSIEDDNKRLECVNQKIACLQEKLDAAKGEQQTLKGELQRIDNRISYYEALIEKTRLEIIRAKKEAAILSTRIEELDKSMQHLATLLGSLVASSYQTQHLSDLEMFMQSANFTAGMHKKEREEIVSLQTSKLLFKAADDKKNFDEQKQQREQQEEELHKKTEQLKKQQAQLAVEKENKAILLEVSKNDEKKYQNLIEEAKKEIDSFKRFAQNAGGGSCLSSSPGQGNNGWFFSQRDPRWCKQYIGRSNMTIGEVGCLIASVTMVHKKYGSGNTPSSFAQNNNNFFSNTAYMLTPPAPSGYTYKRLNYFSKDTIDNELKADRPVIVHVSVRNGYGGHFVVLISGENGNYKMHDPWYGPDLDFNSRYNTGMIKSIRLFTK